MYINNGLGLSNFRRSIELLPVKILDLKLNRFLKIADPIERERVLEKREKNRVAAEKARQKKRERIDELEREKKRLEELIAASDLDAVRIQRNLDYLRVSFQEHEKVCCFKK